MTTARETITAALQSHAYTSYDYGYHCICGHTERDLAGMVGHIADKILAATTLPAFTQFQIEWQVRDTKTGRIDDADGHGGAFAFTSRAEAEQMIHDWPEDDLELVCREAGTTDWHTPTQAERVAA